MVEKQNSSQTSSRRGLTHDRYDIQLSLRFDWLLPKSSELKFLENCYEVVGTLGAESCDPRGWKRPPHQAFANLPVSIGRHPVGPVDRKDSQSFAKLSATKTFAHLRDSVGKLMRMVDPKAMRAFVMQYGVLRGMVVRQKPGRTFTFERAPGLPAPYFYVNSDLATEAQDLLRKAWGGGDETVAAVKEIEVQALLSHIFIPGAPGVQLQSSVQSRRVELVAKDLWSLICLLFLRDYAAGRTCKCANSECPVPYFLKNRRTQKICESGDCVAWAQREYALKWWHKNRSTKPARSRRRKQ